MESFGILFAALLPIYGLMGAGAVARMAGWLSEDMDRNLIRLIVNLLIPCLILDSMVDNEALRRWDNLLLPPLIGFGAVAVGCALGYAAARLVGAGLKQARTFAFVVGIYNYGYFPIPLAVELFDRETLAVLLVQNTGVEVAFWTVGIAVLRGSGGGWNWRMFITAPVIAVVLGAILNTVRAVNYLPPFPFLVIEMLGQCAVPLGLLLVGAAMADFRSQIGRIQSPGLVLLGSVLSLGVLAAIGVALAGLLPVSVELKRVILLHAIMPPAMFCVLITKSEKGDLHLALQIVMISSLAALITIPLWLDLSLGWIESGAAAGLAN